MHKRHINLDQDGVLMDLDTHVLKLIGRSLKSFPDSQSAWNAILPHADYFFRDMEPLPDARYLVENVLKLAEEYNCTVGVLTAIPKLVHQTITNSKAQKKHTIEKHFPELLHDFNVGPYAEDKYKHCRPRYLDILIDDHSRNIDQWNEVGGVGILHKNADETLTLLQEALKNKG